jgi:signal transduction histidine kinase
MAACSSYATAWFENGPEKEVQTYFTKYLADTIDSGIPGEPAELRLRVIFGRARERLAYDSCPLPEDRNVDSAGDFPFARNAVPPLAQDETSSDMPSPAGDELGNLRAILTNISRRNQPLIERLARMIDSMEQNENDPDRLAKLFSMDHLITRARRNSENLLVLAGEEPLRKWSEPVALTDIARAAASEIEQYSRVALAIQPGIMISGQAAADVVHLLAELIENATLFSPQNTQVRVTVMELSSSAVLVEVRDDGIGVSPNRLADMNWQLSHLPAAGERVRRQMGLYVVSCLAARHGIEVKFRSGTPQGLSALIWLPPGISSFTRIASS